MSKAAKEGMRAGKVPPIKDMLKDYYLYRGWDENGKPSRETLDALGLSE